MALTFGALVLEERRRRRRRHWDGPVTLYGKLYLTQEFSMEPFLYICLITPIKILCREWKCAPTDLIAFDFEVLIDL